MSEETGTARAPEPRIGTKLIVITPGATSHDKPSVDHRRCHLSKEKQETIVWKLNRPGTFKVTFTDGSPFAKSEFTETNPDSGVAMVQPGPTPFKYSVTVDGGPVLDPDVIVDQ